MEATAAFWRWCNQFRSFKTTLAAVWSGKDLEEAKGEPVRRQGDYYGTLAKIACYEYILKTNHKQRHFIYKDALLRNNI